MKLKPNEILVLKRCKEGSKSHNDFIYPKNGTVECPDWKDTKECGNGLHGWTPDWNNEKQSKVAPFYNHKQKKWLAGYCSNSQYGFDLPNFQDQSDCQNFIDNNLSDLNLFI